MKPEMILCDGKRYLKLKYTFTTRNSQRLEADERWWWCVRWCDLPYKCKNEDDNWSNRMLLLSLPDKLLRVVGKLEALVVLGIKT